MWTTASGRAVCPVGAVETVTMARTVDDPEVLRLGAAGRLDALGRKAALEQFAHRRGPAGHAALEAPGVERFEFFWRQHDLEPLAPHEIV